MRPKGPPQRLQPKLQVATPYQRALVHFQKGELADAQIWIDKAVSTMKATADLHQLRGLIAYRRGDYPTTVTAMDAAIAINDQVPEFFANKAAALRRLGRLPEAAAAARGAIERDPLSVGAHNNLGLILKDANDFPGSYQAFKKALELKPDFADAWANLAWLLAVAGRAAEAEQAARKALELDPRNINAHNNLGSALMQQDRLIEAGDSYGRAVALDPGFSIARSNVLFCANYRTDLTAEQVYALYREWDEVHARPVRPAVIAHRNVPDPNRRIRLAYISPDFKHHAVAFFLEPLVKAHDRSRFELTFYAEVANPDPVTARFQAMADRWRSTVGMSDAAVAEMITKDEIDIIVDLGGHSAGNRLLALARKPAPVQVAQMLGTGYTSGLSTVDGFIADAKIAPPGSEHLFSEKIVRLPRIPLVYEPPAGMPGVADLPALRDGRPITFGSFSRTARINEGVVEVWAEILKRVPNSRLVLNTKVFAEESTQAAFAARFAKHDVPRERLLMVYTQPQPRTWAAYGDIDVALDPFPHNAGTTTIEALYMGVPVVSLADRPSVGRFGAMILGSLGMDDWVAPTKAAYVERAVAAVADLPALAKLRAELRPRFEASPMFDAPGLARATEEGYLGLWRDWCASRLAGAA